MTNTLTTQLRLAIGWQLRKVLDLSTVADQGAVQYDADFANGVETDQADALWHDRRTLLAGASDDLDLASGLTNSLGESLSFAKLKGLFLRNLTLTPDEIIDLGGGSNPFESWLGAGGDAIHVGPGGVLLVWNPATAGYPVAAGTADILRVTNAGASPLDYEVILIGTTS